MLQVLVVLQVQMGNKGQKGEEGPRNGGGASLDRLLLGQEVEDL